VRFGKGVQTAIDQGCQVLLEVGPGATLVSLGRRMLADAPELTWLTSLRADHDDWQQVLESVGGLYVRGVTPDWAALELGQPPRRRVRLPSYPFQRSRYWFEPAPTPSVAQSTRTRAQSLLGRRLQSPLPDAQFETHMRATDPLLVHHQMYGTAVVPAASHIAMLLAACAESLGSSPRVLEGVAFREPLSVAPDAVRTVQVTVTPHTGGRDATCQVVSLAGNEGDPAARWRMHATATAQASLPTLNAQGRHASVATLLIDCGRTVSSDEFYARMAAEQMHLGHSFRWIEQVWFRPGEAVARLRVPEPAEANWASPLHPGVIDALFQLFGATWSEDRREAAAYAPVGLERFVCNAAPASAVWAHAVLRPGDVAQRGTFIGDIWLIDDRDHLVAEAVGVCVRPVSVQAVATTSGAAPRESRRDRNDLPRRLTAATSPLDRHALLLDEVREHAARALELGPSQVLDPHKPLYEMGLDSLMALDLAQSLGAAIGRGLPPILVFDHPTLDALARYLDAQLDNNPPASVVQTGDVRPAGGRRPELTRAAVSDLSEDDLASVVDAELARLAEGR
jgi:acyl transferase domain-containing protein